MRRLVGRPSRSPQPTRPCIHPALLSATVGRAYASERRTRVVSAEAYTAVNLGTSQPVKYGVGPWSEHVGIEARAEDGTLVVRCNG